MKEQKLTTQLPMSMIVAFIAKLVISPSTSNTSDFGRNKSKVGDCSQERPEGYFSIATTPRCREGHYSFPWIAPLYPRSIPYNAEC